MSICAPKPFGSKFLKGGYSYWPLWWYGQKSKLHDMSGHGVDLTPSGAYFDGQGYFFDGSNDYLIDGDGRKVFREGTTGSWYSIYLTEGTVPAKGSIWGTGTRIKLNTAGTAPKITGKIVLRPEYCPNLWYFDCGSNNITVLDASTVIGLRNLYCYGNNISVLDISALTNLEYLNCRANYNISVLDVSALTKLRSIHCDRNNISVLDVSALTLLFYLNCRTNNISTLDVSALTNLTTLECYSNNISLLDVSAITGLSTLKCQNNSMNQDMVDTVLCDMDSHGTSGGTLWIQGNAAPSATGVACRDNLVSRGWSVTTD
ncbi:hypothetical protein DRO54_09550 [Candidatus Bathyarchaeota archaeon]|nr:MAG: hypothetical protein DRO54_09550 [Candidatus Bathyarchaeota archaeon]